ncbi:MAG: sensor histidine kinase [Catenulispora sp.]|nr:sensor histidine kinase [Catenulispora sp.]
MAVGGGLGSGMAWSVHSLSPAVGPPIELAIAVGYAAVLVVLIAMFSGATRRTPPPRPADPGVERRHLEAMWTAHLGETLLATASRMGQSRPQAAQAVHAAVSGGGITGIAAGIAALGEEAARPAASAVPEEALVQAQASTTITRRVLTMLRTVLRELDALERKTEDPGTLKTLFTVDELVTRIRRAMETLAVLGGYAPRTAPRPEEVHTLLRQAVAEIEDYQRVQIVPPVTGRVHGVAAADIIHLVAELVENATKFSKPDTQVTVRVQEVASGLAIDIDDRGLGMDPAECERACALLAGRDRQQVFQRLGNGQLGFLASSVFASRHGIAVLVETNIAGGIHALVLLPNALLEGPEAAPVGAPLDVPVEAPLDTPAEAPFRAPVPAAASAAEQPGIPSRSGRHPGPGPEPAAVDWAARPSLPRREGSYLPQPAAPKPAAPDPASAHSRISAGLLADFQSGYRTAAGDPPSDDVNGYDLNGWEV